MKKQNLKSVAHRRIIKKRNYVVRPYTLELPREAYGLVSFVWWYLTLVDHLEDSGFHPSFTIAHTPARCDNYPTVSQTKRLSLKREVDEWMRDKVNQRV